MGMANARVIRDWSFRQEKNPLPGHARHLSLFFTSARLDAKAADILTDPGCLDQRPDLLVAADMVKVLRILFNRLGGADGNAGPAVLAILR